MKHVTRRIAISLLMLSAPVLATPALAQDTAPARETPRPQDIDPGVNTSAPSQAPDGSSRAEDVDPAVNTSAAPANDAGGATPSTSAGDASKSADAATKAAASTKPAAARGGKPAQGKAVDRLELDTTQITGNRELPKVLYIVPWKRSDLGDLTGKPVNSLVDEVLTPVDRDVFRRENRYYRALTPAEGAPANGNAAPPAGTAPASGTAGGSAGPGARDER
ncbi:MAG TPA: hypothetical protein VG994_20540 [Steroidobacteraceae bacterium]|nr:hypothetical protein [Steroidobacteraceae bacterium]